MTLPHDPLVSALRAALESAYDIESELTGGGMSRVFVATERALNRRVVIKVLPPELAAGVNRDRFRREIQLAAQLQHPHIVPLLSAGDVEGILYYTMPFIEGESLKHALAGGARFSPREVLGILQDVADALAFAHERGVIHRDVKPANVLRTGVHALVADFGVAKALSAALPAVGMTTTGMAIGTPQYMAPEQLAGDPAADHRVDIYALGLLGHELLTGAPTFAEPSPQATLAAQLTRNPAPLEPVRPDAPAGLARLLMQCLEKDARDRPATAREVRAALEDIVLHSGPYSPPVASRSPLLRWAPAAALAAIALISAAGLAFRSRNAATRAVDSQAPGASTPPSAVVSDSTPTPDSAARRQAAVPAIPPPQPVDSDTGPRTTATTAPATGSTRRPEGARARTVVDSIADLVLLLRTQSPPQPVVRPPAPDAVSRAGIAERQASLGPRRKALIVTLPDSMSRDLARRISVQLDPRRFEFAIVENGASGRDYQDSLAVAGGHDVGLFARTALRSDSSYVGEIRLRDFTAHPGYSSNQVSRRLPADSFAIASDTLAVQATRRLATMDGMPRAGAVDPEFRAFEERARNMGPPRRIVIWNHPPHDNLQVQEAGSRVMDVLRAAIRSLPRYVQVPRDSTLSILARSRNRETVMSALNADIMVSVAANLRSSSADSVSWTITVRDLGAASSYQSRSFQSAVTTLADPLALTAPLLSRVLAAIEQMDVAPRK
jgi:serine/threonine protein kinase